MQLSQTRTWNVPDDLMNELACSVITTAAEGGINYWAHVSRYKWGSPSLGHSDSDQSRTNNATHPWADTDREYAEATVHDNEDDEHGPWEIDAAKMTAAIVKIVSGDVPPFYNMGYTETFRDRLVNLFNQAEQNPDLALINADFDFDANDADCAMQIACMDEVVYG